MTINGDRLVLVQQLVKRLYSKPFNENLVIETADLMCRLLDSHYFAAMLLANGTMAHPLIISNNPPEFIPVYLSVLKEDFLLSSMVETHEKTVLRRMNGYNSHDHQAFITTVQKARPISDVVYSAMTVNDSFVGYCALAREGADNVFYSDDDLALFQFVSSFIDDAFNRSLVPPPMEDDVAWLDFQGNILQCGRGVRAALDGLADGNYIPGVKSCRRSMYSVMYGRYRRFLTGPMKPGMERFTIYADSGRRYAFSFGLGESNDLGLRYPGIPFASVRVREIFPEEIPAPDPHTLDHKASRYGLTPREYEVLAALYKGYSNRQIAVSLGVEESTVKRHVFNIFEKTGFNSRVELVLGLG